MIQFNKSINDSFILESLKQVQEIKNQGLKIQRFHNNKWIDAKEYTLPIRYIPLYNDDLVFYGVGIY